MIHKLLGKSRKLVREKKCPQLILLGHERGGTASIEWHFCVETKCSKLFIRSCSVRIMII